VKRSDCVAVLLGVLALVSTGASAFRAEPHHRPDVAIAALPMSPEADRLVQWIRRSGDHGGMPLSLPFDMLAASRAAASAGHRAAVGGAAPCVLGVIDVSVLLRVVSVPVVPLPCCTMSRSVGVVV
jgi:hypothetical protein